MTSQLAQFIQTHRQVAVITGAGCSTDSGIGAYRDRAGNWKHSEPIQHADFMSNPAARQRYWARSMVGWPQFAQAEPNDAHVALAELERQGWLTGLITQNVDRLHQRAGQQKVVDLHGRLDRVRCQSCSAVMPRETVQEELLASNAQLQADLERQAVQVGGQAPDGDAPVEHVHPAFVVPTCSVCGGVQKPDVVFYGDSVPRVRVERAFDWVGQAAALLVVGSSLMVFSSFRFVRAAARAGQPIAILNQGLTRGDELARLKIESGCGRALCEAAETLRGCAGQ